jgi:DNA repair exonuclease SbcCD ATPase subunit
MAMPSDLTPERLAALRAIIKSRSLEGIDPDTIDALLARIAELEGQFADLVKMHAEAFTINASLHADLADLRTRLAASEEELRWSREEARAQQARADENRDALNVARRDLAASEGALQEAHEIQLVNDRCPRNVHSPGNCGAACRERRLRDDLDTARADLARAREEIADLEQEREADPYYRQLQGTRARLTTTQAALDAVLDLDCPCGGNFIEWHSTLVCDKCDQLARDTVKAAKSPVVELQAALEEARVELEAGRLARDVAGVLGYDIPGTIKRLAAELDATTRDLRDARTTAFRRGIEAAKGIVESEYSETLRIRNSAHEMFDMQGARAHDMSGRVLTKVLTAIRALTDDATGGEE